MNPWQGSDLVTTSSLHCQFHQLPVQQRITYKLCLLMHLVGRAPSYLVNSVTAT